jgi:hypothetical protein
MDCFMVGMPLEWGRKKHDARAIATEQLHNVENCVLGRFDHAVGQVEKIADMDAEYVLSTPCFLESQIGIAACTEFAASTVGDTDAIPFGNELCECATRAEFDVVGVSADS